MQRMAPVVQRAEVLHVAEGPRPFDAAEALDERQDVPEAVAERLLGLRGGRVSGRALLSLVRCGRIELALLLPGGALSKYHLAGPEAHFEAQD